MSHKELLVMCAGKADPEDRQTLSKKSKRRAQRMGVWINRYLHMPNAVFHAQAATSRLSAEKTIKACGHGIDVLQEAPALQQTDPQILLDFLQALPVAHRHVLVIAEQETCDILVRSVIAAHSLNLKPAKAVIKENDLMVLSGPKAWHKLDQQSCALKQYVKAKKLPKLFPFPDINGVEQRERPAYYYRQSACIPYRIHDQRGLEILLVTSSSGKHWGIPKGVLEPGLSEEANAAQECLEEAGAQGSIDAQCLGTFQVSKWGAQCSVRVFPLRVSSIIEDPSWEESHRKRRWCSIEEAKTLVKYQELLPLLHQLQETLCADHT